MWILLNRDIRNNKRAFCTAQEGRQQKILAQALLLEKEQKNI
jgi:hypothetical protein